MAFGIVMNVVVSISRVSPTLNDGGWGAFEPEDSQKHIHKSWSSCMATETWSWGGDMGVVTGVGWVSHGKKEL